MKRLLPAFAVVAASAPSGGAAAQIHASCLIDLGQGILPHKQLTRKALGTFQKAEIDKWWPIIRVAGIKAE
jgi:hypothetical protein